MEESTIKISKNTKFLIPIGVVIAIVAFVWAMATYTAKVDANMDKTENLEAKLNTTPTREEFNQMKTDITEIKNDIKRLLTR